MKKIVILLMILLPALSFAQFNYHFGFSMGTAGFDGGACIATDTSGNVICGGNFGSSMDIDPGTGVNTITSLGGDDGFVAKYDASGSLLWGKALGGTDGDGVTSVDADDAGNVYVLIAFQGTADFGGGTLTALGLDLGVIKFDPAGTHIWSKRFGGNGDETGYVIRVNPGGTAIAICGSFEGTIDFGNGPFTSNGSANAFVALLDGNGNAQWSYGFGGGGFALDRATGLAMHNSGDIIVSGVFSQSNVDLDPTSGSHVVSSIGSSDIFISRFSSSGSFINAFHIGGSKGELSGDIGISDAGEIYLTGYSNSDSIDVDPGVSTTYLYGETGILFVQDIILVKLNPAGNYEWGYRIGRRASDVGHSLALDQFGNVFISGGVGDTLVDFDPGTGIHYVNGDVATPLNSVPFIAQFTSGGTFVDAFGLDAKASSVGLDISRDGKIWMSGTLQAASIDLDPGSNTQTVNSAGQFDIFISGYSYSIPVGLNELEESNFSVYPNPVSDHITVHTGNIEAYRVKVHDIYGRLVLNAVIYDGDRIAVNNLSPGMYMVSVAGESRYFHSTFIKD